MRRIGPALVVLAAIAFCVVAVVALVRHGGTPYRGYSQKSVVVEIEPGRPARVVAEELADAGVIRSALLFRILIRMRGADAKIHAGEYEFSERMTPPQVLDKLVRGDVVRHRLTVPEGLRIDEIADIVETSGFGARQAFLAAAGNASLIKDLDSEATDLEGYLFPDTYFFARGVSADRIVEEMVARFRREVTPERSNRMEQLGLSLRDTVTLASLIEEEARVDDERARISAVFHNRLERHMPLQCDPTVVYALVKQGRYRGDIYRSDLSDASPYNTYLHQGLPPGPICSPGALSLEAALHPADTRDLYFVLSAPGRHEFSRTLQEHERAVQRYRHDPRLYRRRR